MRIVVSVDKDHPVAVVMYRGERPLGRTFADDEARAEEFVGSFTNRCPVITYVTGGVVFNGDGDA